MSPRCRSKQTGDILAFLIDSNVCHSWAGASIFVRVDHTRCDVVKALITGPEGTPYAHGAFEFDIFMPLNFPKMPPKVRALHVSSRATEAPSSTPFNTFPAIPLNLPSDAVY